MLRCGTTTCEAKSGYALTTEGELKMLRTIRALGGDARRSSCRRPSWARTKCRSSTATAARAYVDLVVNEMIPAVARERLAEWCDVFCETGVFTPDESREILEAGRARRAEAAHPRRRARGRAAAPRSPPRSARARRIT